MPVRQEDVDEIRSDVAMQLVVNGVNDRNPHVALRHLRFPEDRPSKYLLRKGNPPADSDRHPWERGLRLEIDVDYIPPSLALLVMTEKHKARKEEFSKLPHSSRYELRKNVAGLINRIPAPKLIEPKLDIIRPRSANDIPKKVRLKQVSAGYGGKSNR